MAKGTKGGGKAAPAVTPEQEANIVDSIMSQTSAPDVVAQGGTVRGSAPGTLVYGRVTTGWDYADLGPIEHGQCFKLRGERGDKNLVKLGYVEVFDARTMPRPLPCRLCPKVFISDRDLVGHGERFHIEPARKLTPMEEDHQAERVDEKITRGDTPLYMDKTTASLGA